MASVVLGGVQAHEHKQCGCSNGQLIGCCNTSGCRKLRVIYYTVTGGCRGTQTSNLRILLLHLLQVQEP
ncbi:MAG: hypothetical protein U0T32_07385 [Chitinophagales bacterium]